MSTKISWCDETINPIVGCSKISEGCAYCYAENMARRLAAMGKVQYQSVINSFGKWNGLTVFTESELQKPYKWKAPRSIFVGSMGDMFHPSVPLEWIDDVMRLVWDNPRHTFIFLTKRPELMREYFSGLATPGTQTQTAQRLLNNFHYSQQDHSWHMWYLKSLYLPNLAIGVTAENQDAADERIPILLQIPAAIRFVSIEPMIGPVDLDIDEPWIRYLNGVIIGGESGHKARLIKNQWVIDIRDQCAAAGVPFMFKQWGDYLALESNEKTGLPILDGRTHSDLPWKVRK